MDNKATKSDRLTDEAEIDDGQTNVAKIRDILFGGQMRDYEQRFSQLEKRLSTENRRLADDIQARFDQLDAFIRKELSLITDRLASERKERLQSIEDQGADLVDLKKSMEDKITDFDEVHSAAQQEVRNRLHEQSTEFMQLLRRAQDELSVNVREETTRLQEAKVAREDLAEMLTEMALRLNRDFNLPDQD